MRIGIEASTWNQRRGYGRFTRELVRAMVRGHPEHDFVLVLDQATAEEGDFPDGADLRVVVTRESPTEAASADGSRRIADLWRFGRAVAKERFDVFLFPTRYTFFPLFGSTPTVVAFHDATAELHPDLIFPHARSRLLWSVKTRLALRRADRLVTVSADARRQIAGAFALAPETIDVVGEGPDPIFRPLPPAEATPDVRGVLGLPTDRPLLLYVGGISPHKNLTGLLRALPAVANPWHLALVGEYEKDSFWGCHEELEQLLHELDLRDRVTFTGFVSDADLVRLYNAATLFVLPSMSEGFGLPVIESMACGLPVAASDRGSIPEVLGDAGILFDPERTESMTAAIDRLLADPDARERLRAKGLSRARLFSWEQSARRMMEVIEDLHGR